MHTYWMKRFGIGQYLYFMAVSCNAAFEQHSPILLRRRHQLFLEYINNKQGTQRKISRLMKHLKKDYKNVVFSQEKTRTG